MSQTASLIEHEGLPYNGVCGRQDSAVSERAVRVCKNLAPVVGLFTVRVLDIVDTVSVGLPLVEMVRILPSCSMNQH